MGWRKSLHRGWFIRIPIHDLQHNSQVLERVNEQSVLWPWTPHRPTLSLLQLLPSKENSLRNGLLTFRFWVKCFFGLEELKNNKHFPPISSNCWPSAEPLLPSANPQPLNIVGCVFPLCYLFLMLSYGFSLTK